MRFPQSLLAIPICSLFFCLSNGGSRADDEAAGDEDQEETKKLNELIEKSVDWYEIVPNGISREILAPRPVMRWRNVQRKQDGKAMLAIWCHHGRPEAMASIYPWQGDLCHEFVSLSRTGRLTARDGGSIVWTPASAGVMFQDLPDGPKPADSPAARLRQMKSIADRFSATMTGWKGDDSDREELRLLPRPLYRYELKDSAGDFPSLQDGVLFAYVLGTDPELVLVLESIRRGDETIWQYGFARATSGGLEARLDGKPVWVGEKFPPNQAVTGPQVTLMRPIPQ